MHGSKSLTDDEALAALEFLSNRSDLCLVMIRCLDRASGQFTASNIGSSLDQSQGDDRFNWLAISTASHVDSILFIGLVCKEMSQADPQIESRTKRFKI
jgi:hypothetical protein